MPDAVNLAAKLDSFTDHWAPRIVASMNDYDVMVVRVEGEFVWHSHPDTDDLFLVLDGKLEIELRDGSLRSDPANSTSCRRRSSTVPSHGAARSVCC